MTLKSLLGIALLAGLAACGGDEEAHPPQPTFDVDPAVAACTDLNAHVNNRWLQSTTLRPDQAYFGTLDQLAETSQDHQRALLDAEPAADASPVQHLLRQFYLDGLNETELDRLGFAPAKAEWERIGALASKADLRQYLRDRFAQGAAVVFYAYTAPDLEQPERNILYFSSSGQGLPTPDHYVNPAHATIAEAYRHYLDQLLRLAGVPAPEAEEAAALAFQVERQLAAHEMSPAEESDPYNNYHLKTIPGAEAELPGWGWPLLFQQLSLPDNVEFSLAGDDYFAAANRLLDELPLAHWQAYLRAQWLRSSAPYLDARFRQARFEFEGRILDGRESPTERWRAVLSSVNFWMGEPLGQLYVEHHFEPQRKALAYEIVEQVRTALRKRLTEVGWLTDPTRAEALHKLDTMTFALAYPDSWNDWSDLRLPRGEYFASVTTLAKRKFQTEVLNKLGPVADVPPWGMWPQTVNAYYAPAENHMVFLAAILQTPILDPEADLAVNLGSFGAVAGHEMTHAFDIHGSKYDATGRLRDWWTDEDRAAFTARADKLREQVDRIRPLPDDPDLHVDGVLTLGENIADLGGLHAAYDALRSHLAKYPADDRRIDDLTPEQRFFMSWARTWRSKMRPEALRWLIASDPHAPGDVRAGLPPSNMPSFAQAFQCPAGAPMVVPENQRAEIW
ncbi:MAG: M13 family metallopeptidase [Pigmentiphaga sp.]|nr:M13 family metallopeptidase [Pigmentiphaga sp.]